MELINDTGISATLLRSVSGRDDTSPGAPRHNLGCVVARVTYRLDRGALVPTPDEPWPIGAEAADTPLGMFPGDKALYHAGIDVLVGGTLRLPDKAPRAEVEIAVGRVFRRRIAVFGDRHWTPVDGRFVPSEPTPFRTMELRAENAFGGAVDTVHGIAMPFMDNRLGKGFLLDRAEAAGKPLPNLEDPRALLVDPLDQPEPVGLGYLSMQAPVRALNAIDHPAVQAVKDRTFTAEAFGGTESFDLRPEHINPVLFSHAHPRMIIAADKGPAPGDNVSMTHGAREGALAFTLPDNRMHVHVQLASREYVFPLHLDQVGLIAGEARVMLGYRTVFEYRLVDREQRFATLHRGPAPASIPRAYAHPLSSHFSERV